MPIRNFTYTVLIEPGEDSGYVVTCPALPGVVTEGRTLDEARAMAKEAIECYLESLAKDGMPIPEETAPPVQEQVTVGIDA